jgi:hypothetical protein
VLVFSLKFLKQRWLEIVFSNDEIHNDFTWNNMHSFFAEAQGWFDVIKQMDDLTTSVLFKQN